MTEKSLGTNYISLQEATKFCNYSQEYLSLRARHGKLKSAKIGRNWMTTKEWLEEYLSHNGNGNGNGHAPVARLAFAEPPENLPVEYFERSDFPQNYGGSPTSRHFRMSDILNLRTSFIFALTSILILAGGVFGKESFSNIYKDVSPAINSRISEIQSDLIGFQKSANEGALIVNEAVSAAADEIGGKEIFVGGVSITVGDIAGGTAEIVADYSRWTAQKIKTSAFGKNYIKANNFLEKGLSNDFQNLSSKYIFADNLLKNKLFSAADNYSDASRFLEQKFISSARPVKELAISAKNEILQFADNAYQAIISPVKKLSKGFLFDKSEFEKLKSEFAELKETSFIVKRVEVSKVVEPVKEITREVETIKQITKVDDRALAEIRATMAYLEGEIGKRLYAPGGVISQTIYTKEPVSSPKIYQENGEIVLQTLGSGNVILSAATGLQLYGSQVIIESTSKLSPMIYLANNSRIGGDLAVTGAANISGTLGIGGAASVSGSLTVGGDITVAGTQNFAGTMTVSASSTSAVLTVAQTGTGDILNLKDGSTEVFTVIDGGNVGIATSTPSSVLAVGGDIMGSGNIILYGNATSALAGPLAITTSTAVYQLQLAYDPSNYTKFITNSSGDLNITPSGEDVTITGNLLVTGSPNYGGGASFLLPLTITTTTVPQLLVRYDADNELNIEISSDGTTLFLATGTDANLELRTENFDNAIFVDDSTGRVGIATTSPRYTFDVWGDVAFGTSTATSSTAVVPAFYVSTGNGPRVGIGTTTLGTNLLTIGTTTSALVVSQLNMVGISTTTPSDTFAVQGNILGSGNIVIYGTATSTFGGSINTSGNLRVNEKLFSYGDLYLDLDENNNGAGVNNLFIRDGADSTVMIVKASGYVGIGTTTPSSKLTVSGDIELGMPIGRSATSTKISSATSTFAGGFISLASSTIANYLSVGTSTTPDLFVDSGNNRVGVASSTPSTTFSVQGNILGSGNIVIYGTSATSTFGSGIQTPAIKLTNGASNNFVLTSDANGYATWQDSSIVNPENWSFATANAISPTSTAVGIIVNASSTFTGDLTAGANTLFVNAAGRVGIGTTTPSSKLTVSGDIELGMPIGRSATSTRLSSATSTFAGGFISLASSTIANYLSVGTSTIPDLFADSGNSRVGIASSTPSTTLSVQGNILGSGNIVIYGTSATSTFGAGIQTPAIKLTNGSASNFVLTSDANGYATWQDSSLINPENWSFSTANAISPTSTAVGIIVNASSTFTGDLTVGNSTFFVDAGGNVGIGTTGPGEKLTVASGNIAVGDGTATTTIRYGATGLATSSFSGDISAKGVISVGDGSATSTIRGASAATSTINSGLTVGNNAALVVNQSAPASSLYLDPAGNIGITANKFVSGHSDLSSGISIDNVGALTIDSGTITGGGALWTALTIKNKGNAGVGRGVYFDTQVQSDGATATVGSRIGTIIESLTGGPYPTAQTFWTRTDSTTFSEKMRISSAGNVGIGSVSPGEKLTVASGNIAVGDGTATTTIRYGATGAATSTFAGDISAIGILAVGDGSATSTIRGASAATSTINSGLTVGNNGALVVNQAATANSLYINPSGNVGIGTTTPLSRLSVSGDIVLGLAASTRYATGTTISSATSTFAGGFISLASSTIANYLSVGTSTTPTLFVDSGSGNVGIGTTTSSNKLTIDSGAIDFSGTTGNFAGSGTGIFQSATNQLTLVTAGSSRMHIKSDGNAIFNNNVGIGTTGPGEKLTVASGNIAVGDGTATTTIRYGATGAATSTFAGDISAIGILAVGDGSATSTIRGASAATSTINSGLTVGNNGALVVNQAATANSLYIATNGNVGIGTTGPTTPLHIAKDNGAGDVGLAVQNLGTTNGETASLIMRTTSAGGADMGKISLERVDGNNTKLYFSTFQSGSLTNSLTINQTGNVGIGTTGPGEKLTVASGNIAVGDGTATTTIRYGATGLATSSFSGDISAKGVLSVGDGSATSTIRGASAATSTINSGLTVGNNGALVVNQAATANSLYIATNGNVGIGTTGPGQLLSLQKDQNAQTIARINNTTSGTGAGSQFVAAYSDSQYTVLNQFNPSYTTNGLLVANSAALWTNGNTSGLRILTYDATDLTFGTNNAANVTIKSDGNVGIGTTGPGEKLTVASGNIAVGDGTATTTIRYGATGLATSSFAGDISAIGILAVGDGSATSTIRGASAATSTINSGLTVGNNGALVVNQAATANSLYINPSGNVGIGTTTPYAALTINESSGFAIGSFDENVIDTMEGSHLNWHSSDTTNVATSSQQSIVRVGGQSLKISASGASEDDTVKQTFSANKNWTNYERLGFWIYSDRISTSTATTTQLISFSYHDTGGTESTSSISIQQENRWQYQEITLDGTAANKDAVDYIQFRIDFNSLAAINFYVDQVRVYNAAERSGEMFVGRDGSLVVMGRGGVEIGRADGSTGKPGLKVDTAIVQINQPLAVDVGGDVGMNNDLQFMSTGLSQITSEGPLRIIGGDSNHNENLTLTVGGGGNIIAELTNASSSFMLTQAWTASTSIAFIINSETNATNTNGTGMLFKAITDYASDENTVFSIDVSGNIYYDRGAHTPAADVAENYKVEDNSIGAGDVVCFAGSAVTVEKCSAGYQDNIIGVISTQPALQMSDDLENSKPVALVGRVPVKISLENGLINVGDPLTSASSTPGMAMKATRAGKILGYALEASPPAGGEASTTILAFMRVDQIGGDLTVSQNETGSLVVSTFTATGQKTLFSVDETGAVVVGKLKAQELCVGSVCVTETDFMRVFGTEASPPAGGEASTSTAGGEASTSTAGDSVSTTTEPVIIPDLPDSVIDSGPELITTSTEATFTFHSTKINSVFSCQLEDGSMWAGCDSPKTYAELSVGNHQFSVQAIEPTGEAEPTPSIYSWEIVAMATTTP